MVANWNQGMGTPPTWEKFKEALIGEGITKDGFTYKMPIGDIAPLFLIAFIYMVMMFVRKRKAA
jgi:hypothetical protein